MTMQNSNHLEDVSPIKYEMMFYCHVNWTVVIKCSSILVIYLPIKQKHTYFIHLNSITFQTTSVISIVFELPNIWTPYNYIVCTGSKQSARLVFPSQAAHSNDVTTCAWFHVGWNVAATWTTRTCKGANLPQKPRWSIHGGPRSWGCPWLGSWSELAPFYEVVFISPKKNGPI